MAAGVVGDGCYRSCILSSHAVSLTHSPTAAAASPASPVLLTHPRVCGPLLPPACVSGRLQVKVYRNVLTGKVRL